MNNKLKLLAVLSLSLSLFACNGDKTKNQEKSQEVVAQAIEEQTTVTENAKGVVTEQNTVAEATQEKDGVVNVQGVTQDETFKDVAPKVEKDKKTK